MTLRLLLLFILFILFFYNSQCFEHRSGWNSADRKFFFISFAHPNKLWQIKLQRAGFVLDVIMEGTGSYGANIPKFTNHCLFFFFEVSWKQ